MHEPDTSGQHEGGLKGGASQSKAPSEGRKQQNAVKAATALWKKQNSKRNKPLLNAYHYCKRLQQRVSKSVLVPFGDA